MNLEHDRSRIPFRALWRLQEPALDAAPIDLVPALDRSNQRDVAPGTAHQVADASQLDLVARAEAAGGHVADDDVGRLGAAGAHGCDAESTAWQW